MDVQNVNNNGVNQIPTNTDAGACNQTSKTFTQEEVNHIVQERLARVKAANIPDQRELDLQRRETELSIREKIAENGLPAELAESLKGLEKAAAEKCIEIIAPYAKKATEPILNAVGPTGAGQAGKDDAIRRAMGLKG